MAHQRREPGASPRLGKDLYVGISGWTYEPWRGVFYPDDLPHKRELEFASRQLNSIEINGSFYSLQTPRSYAQWHAQTPDGFVFSVKAGRYITHMRRLKDIRTPLANFLASGLLRLGGKLGPILWQFPPQFSYDPDRFEAFFDLLPRDTQAAARLARRHDELVKGRSWTTTDARRPLRHAVEVRHATFMTDRFIDQLRTHGIALVQADTAGRWPYAEDMTAADFAYVRLHGDEELYVSGYDDGALRRWAKRIAAWHAGREPRDARRIGPAAKNGKDAKDGAARAGRDVYVYFDNDVKVRAPYDAMRLAAMLGLRASPPDAAEPPAARANDSPRARWPGVRPAAPRSRQPRASTSKTRPARRRARV